VVDNADSNDGIIWEGLSGGKQLVRSRFDLRAQSSGSRARIEED
jgi:hypothetical protein